MGGWGLGLGREEKAQEDDDDKDLNWDQAQVRCPNPCLRFTGRPLISPAGGRGENGRHGPAHLDHGDRET